jgi:hypothetical protein
MSVIDPATSYVAIPVWRLILIMVVRRAGLRISIDCG